jgi:hypothetical protein
VQVEGPWSTSFWFIGEREVSKSVRNRGEKIFFFPCFARSGEEEDPQCLQSGTISAFFFFIKWIVYETAPFWAKHAVSFKWKRRQTYVKVQISPQFVICSIESSIANFDFKNQFNCIPVKFNRRPWSWPPFPNWSLVSN